MSILAANSERTASGRGKGRPFQKGQSGNPNGRPKQDPDVKALIKANTVRAIETIIVLMDSDCEKVALAAAQEILNRALGKPEATSKVELSGRVNGPVVYRWMTEADLKR